VATEVCALLARRIGNPAALDFLRWAQRGAISFDRPEAGTLAEVLAISERFHDLPFDLADASVAEAAARLRIRHLLTLDADFDVYRDKAGKALINVLRSEV
jgi:predicted nucleic acid-binding protein